MFGVSVYLQFRKVDGAYTSLGIVMSCWFCTLDVVSARTMPRRATPSRNRNLPLLVPGAFGFPVFRFTAISAKSPTPTHCPQPKPAPVGSWSCRLFGVSVYRHFRKVAGTCTLLEHRRFACVFEHGP